MTSQIVMIVTTPTGRTLDAAPYTGSCRELVDDPEAPLGLVPCGRPGTGISIETAGPGREPTVSMAYCDDHGGAPRAFELALADWAVLAPATVENPTWAGCESLGSEHVYIVIRELPDACGGGWVALRGVGSHTMALAGGRRFESDSEALEAALEEWRAALTADVERIREIRGGTLAWGLAVEPREEPIVLRPRQRESAWDCALQDAALAALVGPAVREEVSA